MPIKWLIRRVADFNRRLRFSLTPKNFVSKFEIYDVNFNTFVQKVRIHRLNLLTCLSSQTTGIGGKVFHWMESQGRAGYCLFGGDEPNALVNRGQGLLGKLVGLVGAAGKQAV